LRFMGIAFLLGVGYCSYGKVSGQIVTFRWSTRRRSITPARRRRHTARGQTL
jgi:hypothetical protein